MRRHVSLLTLISSFVVITMIGCTKDEQVAPTPPPLPKPPKINHAVVIPEQTQSQTQSQTQMQTHTAGTKKLGAK